MEPGVGVAGGEAVEVADRQLVAEALLDVERAAAAALDAVDERIGDEAGGVDLELAILDPRIVTRTYGRVLLDSLPAGLPRTSALEQVRRWWRAGEVVGGPLDARGAGGAQVGR